MQISLNVEGHQLTDQVNDLLKNLSSDQLQDLTKQMLVIALSDVNNDLNQQVIQKRAIESVRSSIESTKDKSDEFILKEYPYRVEREKKDISALRVKLVSEIVNGAVQESKKQIADIITKDEKIQTVISETLDIIKKDFAKYVQNAMTVYLAEQMKTLMSKTTESLMVSDSNSQFIQELDRRLLNKGI